MIFIGRIVIISVLLLSLQSSALPGFGWCMTTTETNQSITIPIQTWQNLRTEFQTLQDELILCKTDLSRLKKPSMELVNELSEAEKMLKSLQEELTEQRNELTLLSNEVDGLRTSLLTLKEKIEKERRVHRRQIWQSRIWSVMIGIGVGYAIGR